jgi:hypothetical protein
MTTADSLPPEDQQYDYKLILTPYEDKSFDGIQDVSQGSEKYSTELPMTTFAEVTLVSFKQNQAAEDRIIKRLQLIARANPPIQIDMKDFNLPPTSTIYFTGLDAPVTEFIEKLKHEAGALMKLDVTDRSFFVNDNKVRSGKEMNAWQYDSGWMEISNEHFNGILIANTMMLMKRKENDFKFQQIASFDFLNLPEETKQGVMF